MRVYPFALLSVVCGTASLLYGQSMEGALVAEKAGGSRQARAATAPAALSAPPAERSALRLSGLSAAEQILKPRGLARQSGVVRAVEGLDPAKLDWTVLSDGRQDGRLLVESAGAVKVRVHFVNFDAGQGEVWLRRADGTVAGGPYTGQGPYGDGDFWSDPAEGSQLQVEWVGAQDDQPAFLIDRVSHQWPLASGSDDPMYCQLDVSCYSEYANAAKGVANLDFVADDGGVYICSGELVNSKRSQFAPLFLTANHCMSTETEVRSMVTYWNYQTSKCEGPAPERSASAQISGGTLLASYAAIGGDFTLIQLPKAPSGGYMLGWSATDPDVGAKVTAIHHPGLPPTSWKRIAFGTRDVDQVGAMYIDTELFPLEYFLQFTETGGRVQQGSSGSPLLNGSQQIVGVLSYGLVPIDGISYCDLAGAAGYGKFSVIYPMIREFLEEVPAPALKVSKATVGFSVVDGVTQQPSKQSVVISTDSPRPRGFQISTGAAWLTPSVWTGTVSADEPVTVEFSAASPALPVPGTFNTTATVSMGQVTTASLPVTPVTVSASVNVVSHKPVVVAQVLPDQVVAHTPGRDGTNFEFQLRLEEKAGFAVRISSLKIDGVVYSDHIKDLLGTTDLAANGSIQATIKANLQPSQADRLIEFGGFSPTTGARWSAKATTKFLPLAPASE
ncbi:trypsin-like peptidase domain-containing protein [uncultured Paludibaculum sp.]|uniref:trypsin-like serine peptidase n=1 Tax=uncultured Paludibaculum sp. TaxID=1765020 RepID=UPI002AAABB5F|nr:trypsin-like peptidase domain-containing protein [uncultured Paludibaculum sp.]